MTFFIGRFQIVFTCAPFLCVLTRQVIPLYLMLQRCVTFRHLYNQCDMAHQSTTKVANRSKKDML